MKNENMEGHWIGKLKQLDDESVHLEITEAIEIKEAKQVFMNEYLHKQ